MYKWENHSLYIIFYINKNSVCYLIVNEPDGIGKYLGVPSGESVCGIFLQGITHNFGQFAGIFEI